MAYETRRSRRLRLEREQRQRNQRRVLSFFGALVGLAAFAGIAIYIGRQDLNQQLGQTKSADTEQVDDSSDEAVGDADDANIAAPSPDKGSVLAAALPDELVGINARLGITAQSGLADLPSQTATAVAVVDLSNRGYSNVMYNADTQFTSASTYKIFVAYAMIHDVETGRRTWSSSINGTTWDTCLSRMIVNSDNACPEAYLVSIGYSSFNEIVQSLGVSDQTVLHPYDMRTTAGDLAMILQKLYRGELMSEENKNKLLDLMSQQIYRQGIPTGIGDSGVVYDKVGFLDGLLHDAAIVHTDAGDYVLVVMTNGESWSYIAEVAKYVNSMLSG